MTATPLSFAPNLVSTAWLAERLGDHEVVHDLVIIDASWYLPTENRDPKAEYRAGHIPGAVYFDIDSIADTASGLPHTLPSPDAFASAMRDLGIDERMQIVVYDGAGLFSAARVWWTFKVFGAERVAVLDGGLPRWKAEGRLLTQEVMARPPRTFTPRFDAAAVADAAAVIAASRDGNTQVIDARSGARFRGEAPEPRPGVRPGHIPASRNVHYADLVVDGSLRPPTEIAGVFAQAGVDLDKPIITTCGSGVTAAIVTLALAEAGKTGVRLYDGSWSEWGARADLPAATGPA